MQMTPPFMAGSEEALKSFLMKEESEKADLKFNIQKLRIMASSPIISCLILTFFLTSIQVPQEAGKVIWYFHLFKNFPQFAVIYTVKCFEIINKAEVDVFLEFSCFFYDRTDVGNLISGSSDFSKSRSNIWKFSIHVLLKPGLENIELYFTSV